jgi:hypothetical protein
VNVEYTPTDTVPQLLEREIGLIYDAIALVASGSTPRVVVAGLQFGEQLLEPIRRVASERGVQAIPLWTADATAPDIAIEALADG